MHETRSAERAQLPLDATDLAPEHGVGDRHARPGRRRRGGGYLNTRTSTDVWEDAKIRELEIMGLPAVWIEVAKTIGYDPFMSMWSILDRSLKLRSENESMIEVQLRRLSSYRRFQRNRFIESLVLAGLDDRAIRAMVKVQLGEELSLSHISRLAGRRKVVSE
jgi:hypothetical protein